MSEQEFQQKLGELLTRINDLPEDERSRMEQLATETRDRHGRMKVAVNELQESLDYLRLSVKYLVFDLEATRRENRYLRSLIQGATEEEQGGAQ